MDQMLQVPPYRPVSPPKSYFDRNWKWIVPLIVLGGLLMLAGFVGALTLTILGAMKSSDPYKMALAKARANPEVVAALGTPIQDDWFVTGNISRSGTRGDATLEISIYGPKGKGHIYLDAAKRGGDWTFSELKVKVPDRKFLIDLLAEEQPPPESAKPLRL
jgi:hypothetical protein